MTRDDPAERALRETYEDHEHLVAGGAERLLPAVRARRRRTRRAGYAAVALAVAATAVGVGWAARHATGPAAAPLPLGVGIARTPPAGVRLVSSLGLEIAVPVAWKVNDHGCHQTDAPSVNVGNGPELLCLTATPPRKEYATIAGRDPGPEYVDRAHSGLTAHPVTLDGVAAERAGGEIAGGMYAGWIVVPARDVSVVVRTVSKATAEALLDSARLVDVDANGCPTAQPAAARSGSGGGQFVDGHPAAVTVCYYGQSPHAPLQAGTRRTGAAAVALAAALNAAPEGLNPDTPESQCMRSAYPPHLDALLLVTGADGVIRAVRAVWQGCTGRGLDNGAQQRRLDATLIGQIMDGMSVGYGYNGDLR